MRLTWLFVVGSAAIGCKDKPSPAAKPSEAPTTPAPKPAQAVDPAPAPGPAAVRAPDRPSLEVAEAYAAEQVDAAWAQATSAAIQAVAPELTDVACREHQCRGTLVAASENELVQLTEKLQRADSLRSTDAKNIMLTAPEQVDGKLSMTIYVRYER